ncbi:MAG: aconitase family protein [Planctomycetota bacterium]
MNRGSSSSPRTMIEKIVARHAIDRDGARAGMFTEIEPAYVMTHDNTAAVIPKFDSIFAELDSESMFRDPSRAVFTLDHDIQNHTPENLGKYAKIESFANKHGVDFYRAGTGIGHQVMCERGYVLPGSMVVASDSHSNLYGALGALGTPIVRTDAAVIWATGRTWWRVPPIVECRLVGDLRPGVSGKDVIIELCSRFPSEVRNAAVEFTGEGIGRLTISERMAIANMTTEWGALAGVFPFDSSTKAHLDDRAAFLASEGVIRLTHKSIDLLWDKRDDINADDEASYDDVLVLDLSTVQPSVTGPNSVSHAMPVGEIVRDRISINKAYLLSCVNGRLEDLRAAADVLRDRPVAESVDLYVAAASEEIQRNAEQEGTWQTLIRAGAHMLPPGCGPCIGLGEGTVEAGDVAISATNRNFVGRMGSRDAEVYLASPVVVAESAAVGYITGGRGTETEAPADKQPVAKTTDPANHGPGDHSVDSAPELSAKATEHRAVFLNADSINTDAIYAGAHTYRLLEAEEMAAVVFENYDPDLSKELSAEDVVIAGENFGTGSSREQAATALKHRGVLLVIAASTGETYRRNAFNNAFVVIECRPLVEYLRSKSETQAGSWGVTKQRIRIDQDNGVVEYGVERFAFVPLPTAMKRLVEAGGAKSYAQTILLNEEPQQHSNNLHQEEANS